MQFQATGKCRLLILCFIPQTVLDWIGLVDTLWTRRYQLYDWTSDILHVEFSLIFHKISLYNECTFVWTFYWYFWMNFSLNFLINFSLSFLNELFIECFEWTVCWTFLMNFSFIQNNVDFHRSGTMTCWSVGINRVNRWKRCKIMMRDNSCCPGFTCALSTMISVSQIHYYNRFMNSPYNMHQPYQNVSS